MKIRVAIAALALLAVAPDAHAACTMEQLQQKAEAFSAKWQEVLSKDPQRAQRFAPKEIEATKRFHASVSQRDANYEDVCKLYDELLAELEKS